MSVGVQLMQSKHDVMKIVDDVLTLTLTSIYHCSEKNMKKERLKFSKGPLTVVMGAIMHSCLRF